MKRFLLLIPIILAACSAPQPRVDGQVEIRDDSGGNVQAYLNERNRLEREGVPVRISGYCDSACAIFYSLPTACLAPDARLGFHKATGGGPLGPSLATQRMASHFRGELQERYLDRWSKSETMIRINRETVRRLDPEVQFCD
jgi:hypothetical protein